MDAWSWVKSAAKNLYRILRGVLSIVLLMLAIWYVSFRVLNPTLQELPLGQRTSVAVSAGEIIVSAILTLGLLYLYNQMKNIQEMERRPIVEVANYSLDGNSVVVWLSNYGKGSATDMELEMELAEPENPPIEVKSGFVPLRRESEDGIRRETSVPPEKEYIKFQSTPYLDVEGEDGKVRSRDWGAAVKPLSKEKITEVKFILRIHYSNQLGERESVLITPEPRGADIQYMSRLDSAAHGRPIAETDPSDLSIEVTTNSGESSETQSESDN